MKNTHKHDFKTTYFPLEFMGIHENKIKYLMSLLKRHMLLTVFFLWLIETSVWLGPPSGEVLDMGCANRR